MSYNTRRGGGNFNKGISASQVGQRRSGGPNHYNQNLPSQNYGNQQQESYTYFTQQGPRQPRTPNAQQQMAKQQQMLVQKKQQQSQQQKQVPQKNQTLQQKQQVNQKQQEEELKRKKELELQKQKELELQKQKELELQKQKELELQQQKELELQKQKELELQKQKELELQKQKELLQKQKELELQKQKALELQQQKDAELQKQKELALNELKEQEMLNKKELDLQKQPQGEEQLQKDADVEGMEVDNDGDYADLEAPQPPTISGQGAENRPFKRRFPQRNRKLSKYEIQRRRNLRLSKLLQPKSAMVILNEVGKNVTYNVERSQTKTGPKGYMFKATLVVDDTTHEGHGLSKSSAKNEAAEKALRFLVKHKKLIPTVTAEPTAANPPAELDESMDTSIATDKTEKPVETPLAWQQLASFAIYKLLDSWGEDLEMVKEDPKVDKKPVKKFSAELVNPLMLINQMLPRVNFEEMPRSSTGSANTFNFRAIVDGKTFTGSGVSKKVAKRAVAFAICNEVLGIYYPPHIYTPPPPPPTEEPAQEQATS